MKDISFIYSILLVVSGSQGQQHDFEFDDLYNGDYGYSLWSNPDWTEVLPDNAMNGFNVKLSDGVYTKYFIRANNGTNPDRYVVSDWGILEDNIQVVDNQKFNELGTSRWILSKDHKFIAYETNRVSEFRHSYYATYHVYQINSVSSQTLLFTVEEAQELSFNRFGTVVYIKSNNLYHRNCLSDAKEIQITDNGAKQRFYNGVADWVYEEEMIGQSKAYYFSEQYNYVVYATFDDNKVPFIEYQEVLSSDRIYPKMTQVKYPKAGSPIENDDPNPIVEIWVFDLENDKLFGPLAKPESDSWDWSKSTTLMGRISILPNQDWEGNTGLDTIIVQWMDRFQTECKSWGYVFDSNNTETPITAPKELDNRKAKSRGWVWPNEIHPISDGSGDYLQIQSDGYFYHIFRITKDGLKTQVSAGEIDVTKIYAVKPNYVYYQRQGPDAGWVVTFQAATTPATRDIFSVNLNGGPSWNRIKQYPVYYNADPNAEPSETTTGTDNGVWYCFTCVTSCWQGGINCDLRPYDYKGNKREHRCNYNDMYIPARNGQKSTWLGNDLAIYTCLSEDHVPYQFATRICEHTENFYPHSNVKIVTDNFALEKRLDETNRPTIKRNIYMSKGTQYKFKFPYQINFPKNYDPADNKKYPVYFAVYGGPDSQKVTTRYSSSFDLMFMTSINSGIAEKNQGAISIYIDVRGSSYQGDALRFATYLKMGEPEINDVREFSQALLNNEIQELPADKIENSQTAIWGWSYGGFFTSHIAGSQDKNFNCGVAVAPVSSWDLYDTIYSERYMQSKSTNNGNGYKNSFGMEYISKERNDGYFMKYTNIHGMADDNVHFQNSAKISKKLIQEGFEFGNYFYADENHSIYSSTSTNKHIYRLIWRKFQDCYE